MKTLYNLPDPKKYEGLIHHINGRLRDLEKDAGIKCFDIKTKPKINKVVIVSRTDEQLKKATELLDDLIVSMLYMI